MSRILIVHTDHEIRYKISGILRELDCDVTEFPRTWMALALLRVVNPFTVIFVEIGIPPDTGLSFIAKIRAMHTSARIVAILPTSDETLAMQVTEQGANYTLADTHDKAMYRTALDTLLGEL
jgi:CheY-like chemotaxis protein